ncbi:MAG: acylglycerol kinase family protein [Clostridium fessum]
MAKYEDGVMYYFIINPASQSGRGYKIWKKIEQRLVRDGVEYQAYLTEYAGQATEYARKLTSHCKEARVIVVVGGDRTMNEVVDGIVSCDMV